MVVNRLNPQRTAFIACMIILGTCGAGAQTSPLLDPSVAQKPLAPLSGSDPVVREGLFRIDAVVADSAGTPVSDLAPWDFTLLDNGQPAKIRTWHNSLEASEPAPELIFVLDAIKLSSQQLTQTESAIVHFLERNGGHLEDPCFLYRLTQDGLFSSSDLTRDGNQLAKEVEQHKSPRTVWRSVRNDGPNLLRAEVGGAQPNTLSLRALGSIAIDQRQIRRHKVVVWISPGSPVNSGEIGFDEATELSTRLREARIMLDNVSVWPNPDQSFNYRDHIKAPRSQKDMQPAKLALPVIATQTGGLVLDSSGDLYQDIKRCVDEIRSFYTLTFNPPHTYQMDEFHDIRVQVDRPALTVRAPTGYYNEPVYFDNPRPGIEKMTVAQLEELVRSRTDLLQKLRNLELTERLSTPRLDALLSVIHDERERQALTVDADLSFALAPPPDEIVNRPPPPVEEQRAMLGRTFDYLQNVIPKLPDFYALRNTVRFEEPLERDNEIWKMPRQDQTLQFATGEHATVLYRNGHEVDEEKQKLGKHRAVSGVRARGLETRGTFGPILAYVLTAAATRPSTVSWKRWERGKDGDLAVFSYKASSSTFVPVLSYCCLPEGDGTTLYRNKADDYGEFAVNPDTGAIMRIVINADLDEERDPDVPLIRSQIMVEYGPEDLGGKTYIGPQRSVEVSRGRSERELCEWGMVFSLYSSFETMINDVTFGGYHKFGSEFRMLPGFEDPEASKPQAAPIPSSATKPSSPEASATELNSSPQGAQPPPTETPGTQRAVNVAQLTTIVAEAKGKDDSDTARQLERLRLMERLSSLKMATLRAELPGEKSRTALTVLADVSMFLEPPADETPSRAAPVVAEQKRIVSQATDYLKMILPKLPDFYARRVTASFEKAWTPKDKNSSSNERPLHPAGKFKATVYYRQGAEVVHEEGKREHGLITRGTFGPILSTVTRDAEQSDTIQWSRWEQGPHGPMAVFNFQVPQTKSHFSISASGVVSTPDPTAYHGEVGIDPDTGTILRLLLEADPDLSSLLHSAGIMVEYGSVVIGGKTYTCPVRSVSYSVGTLDIPVSLDVATSWNREAARLNDVVFDNYHVFRSDMRMIP